MKKFYITEQERRQILSQHGLLMEAEDIRQGAYGDKYQYRKDGNKFWYAFKNEGDKPNWIRQLNVDGVNKINTLIYGGDEIAKTQDELNKLYASQETQSNVTTTTTTQAVSQTNDTYDVQKEYADLSNKLESEGKTKDEATELAFNQVMNKLSPEQRVFMKASILKSKDPNISDEDAEAKARTELNVPKQTTTGQKQYAGGPSLDPDAYEKFQKENPQPTSTQSSTTNQGQNVNKYNYPRPYLNQNTSQQPVQYSIKDIKDLLKQKGFRVGSDENKLGKMTLAAIENALSKKQ